MSAMAALLQHDVVQHLPLVCVQLQPLQDQLVPFDHLGGGKADRQPRARRMVLDQVDDRMQAAVNRAAVVLRVTEILPNRTLLVFRNVHRVANQLVHALVFRRGDGHDGHAQHRLHRVHVHAAAVARHLVHHVERDHRGDPDLQQLHGEVQVAFDVRGVHDVDDRPGLVVQHEVPRHQLLAGIRGHGIDARQVRDQRIRVTADDAVLPVHRHAGEIADVLVGARQLVEQRRLAAVLVANEGKSQPRPLRQRVPAALRVELALFAQARVFRLSRILRGRFFPFDRGLHVDPGRVRQAQRQLVAVHAQLHRVAHGGQLFQRHLRARYHAHIQEVLPQGALAAHARDFRALSDLQISQRHGNIPFLSNNPG